MPHTSRSHAARQARNIAGRTNAAYAATRHAQHGPDVRSTARWRRVRALALQAQPLCADIWGRHAATGRVEPAVEVDHIRSLALAPELAFTLENLQSLCRACHALKTARERGQASPIWLVCGPPAAGKTTYVLQRAQPTDLIVDFDGLLQACTLPREARLIDQKTLSGFAPYIWAAYDAMIAQRESMIEGAHYHTKNDVFMPPMWIIGGMPDRKRRRNMAARLGASSLILAIPPDQCRRHLMHDGARESQVEWWMERVDAWWHAYEPDAYDIVYNSIDAPGEL